MPIPPKTQRLLDAYVKEGKYPGEFLKGILTNDLHKTLRNGDYEEIKELYTIYDHVLMSLPLDARGSLKKYKDWRITQDIP